MITLTARLLDSDTAVRLTIRHGVIQSILPLDMSAVERQLLPWVAPGLFDLQLNGFRGIWFSSESLTMDEVESVITAFAEQGITGCLPTLITNSCEAIEHGLRTIFLATQRSGLVRDMICGCHVEGPWISPDNGPRGAHPVAHVRAADWSELERWQTAAGGLVKLVTLAPEAPGALDLIPAAVQRGIVIALGHTAADGATISEAIQRGARLGTHLGNGCAGMIPRHDNVFWPQLADDRLAVSVIADGWHVPTPMLKCILRCKTLDRLILTSDVSGFGGCPPGRYTTPAVDVEVLADGRIVVAGQTQFLAGSGATTGECVARFHQSCEVPLADAWTLASFNPTRLLGLETSTITEGQPAFLTVFRMEPDGSAEVPESRRFVPQCAFVRGTRVNAPSAPAVS